MDKEQLEAIHAAGVGKRRRLLAKSQSISKEPIERFIVNQVPTIGPLLLSHHVTYFSYFIKLWAATVRMPEIEKAS